MNHKTMTALEFDAIRTQLASYGISDLAKEKLSLLTPSCNEKEVKLRQSETTQGVKMLQNIGTPPLPTMQNLDSWLDSAAKGSMLMPEQLTEIALFLTACSRMKQYLSRCVCLQVEISGYGGSISTIKELHDELQSSIRNNMVDGGASTELKNLRRKIDQCKDQMKSKLESLLRSKKEWFTEGYVSMRNGHYVLPVRKEFKNQMGGSVLDISSSGTTYFIEPSSVSKIKEELSTLEIHETNEVHRILYTLTDRVLQYEYQIKLNVECLLSLDIIFAKAKLSTDMKAVPPTIHTNRTVLVKNGRHPLLKKENCVPLNFILDKDIQGIVITGPNTGGKTVALKTIGLFLLMAQSGLHVPCEEATLPMVNSVFCDIGDGQSITENLSTFSSHISNIINILTMISADSFVLLDELGSGTDPGEGMGIAIAILEELKQRNCLFVATTHYPEVKDYANDTEGLQNARMTFDPETLRPLYQLEIGEAGESCALYIAKRMGFPKHMLVRAFQEAYGKSKEHKPSAATPTYITSMENQKLATSTAVAPSIVKIVAPKKEGNKRSETFQIGDSVMVYPQRKIGIVFKTTNPQGEVGVQIQKKKELINHKRLKLKAAANELYPPDYDFSIIFDTVANRKARHDMDRKHCADLTISYDDNI